MFFVSSNFVLSGVRSVGALGYRGFRLSGFAPLAQGATHL